MKAIGFFLLIYIYGRVINYGLASLTPYGRYMSGQSEHIAGLYPFQHYVKLQLQAAKARGNEKPQRIALDH